MALPPLKLVVVQGPKAILGKEFEHAPGSTFRIGRLVRGKNLTIKDDGISSTHLVIGSGSGKWIVEDLDSSNGTTLNSNRLPPRTPFDLRDGDTIKLGEFTSLLVQFVGGDSLSQLKSNPSRRGRGEAIIHENSGLESENLENLKGGRGKSRVLDKDIEIKEKSENSVAVAKPRVTRSRKNKDCVILETLDGECAKKTRGGRARRKKEAELLSESAQVDVTENKENIDSGFDLQKEALAQKNEDRVNGVKEIKLEALSAEKACKIAENAVDIDIKENEEKEAECEIMEDGKKKGLGAETTAENGVDLEKNGGKVQTKASKNLGEKPAADLENMTLGQWFVFMEEHLPKQIIKTTEEMIEGMEARAHRVKEYIIEQKKAQAAGKRKN